MTRRLSSLEVLLSVVATLLLICCVGLIVISYLSLKPEGAVEPVQLTGQMVIKQGAEFSEELKNSSSLQFKSLAFDIQKLVSEAFSLSELKQVYKFCQVQHFSQGSVVVTFDLWFDQLVEAQEAEQQLEAGLQDAEGGGLVIDRNSIHITAPLKANISAISPLITKIINQYLLAGHIPPALNTAVIRPPLENPTLNPEHTTGLSDITHNWFTSYLIGRTEHVILGKTKSYPHNVTCGVPQSSVLGPTLYLSGLSFDTHIKHRCKTSFYHLRSITKLHPALTLADAEKFVHAFVSSRLDYCNALLIRSMQRTQSIQNSAVRILMRVYKHEYITPILKSLHWLPVSLRIEFMSCGVLRVDTGLSIQLDFRQFETEESIDTLRLYEGIGLDKLLTAELSGSTPPGTVWLLTDQSTVEFASDDIITLPGFKATYSAANMSSLSNQEKLSCSFENGMCFWRQPQDDDSDWIRTSGSTFPPNTGPSGDHTLGNGSGFYIVTPVSPSQQPSSFRIHSLPLAPPTRPMCLSFWYHMFGENVHRLRVLLLLAPTQTESTATVLFQKDGNYGNTWNYGQVTLNLTSEATVTFEALKKGGFLSDIALDDITLTSDACGPAPPEPTNVPPPLTPPPIPADCGGPFNLWEPNSTFSSPNYPQSYGNEAECVWTLHAAEGHNIQLHFLDFDIEATFDVVEVRDGAGLNSTLLAVLTGSDGPAHDLFSTANQMTVRFFTDESGFGRGFKANFTSGVDLGAPAPCAGDQFQCQTGSCVHGNSLCDGAVDCPDASDEANC
ncbi:enteropeptidase, partial [Stegastes partitus]|uniref:Enteropeptidase n=1 Tax=Stegastes partitus TaxID=144197 RepID=A0A9Y4U308_9TELE